MVIKGLEEKVFSDEGMEALVKRLNEVQQERITQQSKEFERLKKELAEVDRQINNAVKLTMDGFVSEALKTQLSEAEKQKTIISLTLNSLTQTEIRPITIDMMRKKVLKDKEMLSSENPLEVKEIIQAYTTKIIRNPESIETIYIVTFIGGGGGSRTPVRKVDHKSFSGCRPQFKFRRRPVYGRTDL
jgi:site-specific DNA recombinase